jgi:hypothetical protein
MFRKVRTSSCVRAHRFAYREALKLHIFAPLLAVRCRFFVSLFSRVKKKQQQHRSEEILKAPESAPCALNSKFKSLCISEAGPKKHRNRDLVRLISRNVKCLLWPYMALASPSSSSFSARKREQRCNKCCRSASQRTRGRGLLDEMRNEIFSLCFTKHHTFPFCCLACQPSRHGLPRIREMSTSPWPKRIFSQPFSLLNRRILYLENKIHLLLRSPNMFLSALFFLCVPSCPGCFSVEHRDENKFRPLLISFRAAAAFWACQCRLHS